MVWPGRTATTLPLYRASDKRKVANHIHKLMAGRLVVPLEGLRIYVAEFAHFHSLHTHKVAKTVDVFLAHRLIINHDCIVDVSTLDKTVLEEESRFL